MAEIPEYVFDLVESAIAAVAFLIVKLVTKE